MIQGISAADERFLSTLDQIDERLTRAQRDISSGRRINVASDHPDQVSAALTARAGLEQTLQIQLNLGRAKTEASTAEQSLASVGTLLNRVSSLAVQGATETQEPEQRKTIAVEVGAILDQLVSIAGTQVEGRYIFSGDSDRTVPYTFDDPVPPTTTPTVSAYAGTPSTRQLMHPNGTRFDVALSAQEIFDDPSGSVFASVAHLRDALLAVPTVPSDDPNYQTEFHDQTDQINAALAEVHSARDHAGESLAYYGVVQNRIDEASNFSHKLELEQRDQLSAVQDTDLTGSILELTQASNQRQAALAARAQRPQSSLFDYLG
jgi:flagellar hook-associated protein 3 FlgL